jgi:hypothetical protein
MRELACLSNQYLKYEGLIMSVSSAKFSNYELKKRALVKSSHDGDVVDQIRPRMPHLMCTDQFHLLSFTFTADQMTDPVR